MTRVKKNSPTWAVSAPVFESDRVQPAFDVSAWAGHRNFAYDLVRFTRPDVIAELGTYYGTSLFAFAQAVKDFGLETRLIAVDTWRGDDHTGHFGEEVYSIVRRTADEFFSEQDIELERELFDRAATKIDDRSVDILHIDGFHSYKAVENDYNTWLPKLKPSGIVLFHDVAESTGFGSARFWADLKRENPHHIEFKHSAGLGVLFPKGPRWFDAMIENNFADKLLIYAFQAFCALQVEKLKEQQATMTGQSERIAELEAQIAALELAAKDKME